MPFSLRFSQYLFFSLCSKWVKHIILILIGSSVYNYFSKTGYTKTHNEPQSATMSYTERQRPPNSQNKLPLATRSYNKLRRVTMRKNKLKRAITYHNEPPVKGAVMVCKCNEYYKDKSSLYFKNRRIVRNRQNLFKEVILIIQLFCYNFLFTVWCKWWVFNNDSNCKSVSSPYQKNCLTQ